MSHCVGTKSHQARRRHLCHLRPAENFRIFCEITTARPSPFYQTPNLLLVEALRALDHTINIVRKKYTAPSGLHEYRFDDTPQRFRKLDRTGSGERLVQ